MSLYELNQEVRKILKDNLSENYWVIGEISEIKLNNTGHCYLELVEKDESTDGLRARARAIIWSTTFRILKPYFETTTGIALAKGIKVLVKVIVEFHELYGYSLIITDIEPSYTIGEFARTKQETINRLIEEGVIDMNKSLPFPLLPRKVAVISSETAAGYGDFCDQLLNNPYQYKFYIKLFPALMQGEEAEKSIIEALDNIYRYEDFFDVVVLIRGGGSQADLSCFNNYWLAYNITQFPRPVLTGIGHEQDESVVDIVAHTRLKTPTAVAEYLISIFQDAEDHIIELQNNITDRCLKNIVGEKDKINVLRINTFNSTVRLISQHSKKAELLGSRIKSIFRETVIKNSQWFVFLQRNLKQHCAGYISNKNYAIEILEEKNHYLDPRNILKRGYSITMHNGVHVKSAGELKSQDLIDTILYKGRIKSKVMK
jgi:exodeoxyribonuclease VII large subunit